jgi:hypothetical protein
MDQPVFTYQIFDQGHKIMIILYKANLNIL